MRLPRIVLTASFRLVALYALLFALSVVALGGFVFLMSRSALQTQMEARIEAEMASLRRESTAQGLDRLANTVAERGRGAGALDYLLLSPNGRRLAGDLPSPGSRRGWVDLDTPEQNADEEGSNRVHMLVVSLADGSTLAVGDDIGRIEEVEEAVLGAFAWALAATIVLGLAGGLVLSAGFLRRLDGVIRTAEAIVDGDLARRMPVSGADDDFDRLASTLNRMLDRIAALMESLRQVSNDVAHDLRTPLSRLRQRLEAVRLSAASVADYEAAIDAALIETDSILDTFSALLRIAQIESGMRRAGFKEVRLDDVVRTVVEAFAPSAEEEGKSLVVVRLDEARVRGDRELLTQLVANLVENAIRHTPAGTRIAVQVTDRTSGASLAVADNGPGIPEAERARIFHRFYRLERSRATPGSGLGLSLAAAVADIHDATVRAEDNAPGLRMVVDFPLPAPRP
ncbi:MAG: ATP-binding protein [Pseudomonadota bacterium]